LAAKGKKMRTVEMEKTKARRPYLVEREIAPTQSQQQKDSAGGGGGEGGH